jgi:hypothetical protein
MTVVAVMITINTHGKWRAAFSAMLSACLLGGTVWLFTIQYSAMVKDDSQSDRRRLEMRDLLPDKKQAAADMLKQRDAQTLADIVDNANGFADELVRASLYVPAYSHEQLVAAANSAEARFEELLDEVNDYKLILDKYPEAARLINSAMENLKGACHFYKAYYYAENTDGEVSAERLMKQKARNAKDTLGRMAQAVKPH